MNDHAILWQAAIESVGIALLPELVCREAIADGRLQWLLPDWTSREAVLHLVFTSRRGLLPGVRAFLDFAAVALDPLASGGAPRYLNVALPGFAIHRSQHAGGDCIRRSCALLISDGVSCKCVVRSSVVR